MLVANCRCPAQCGKNDEKCQCNADESSKSSVSETDFRIHASASSKIPCKEKLYNMHFLISSGSAVETPVLHQSCVVKLSANKEGALHELLDYLDLSAVQKQAFSDLLDHCGGKYDLRSTDTGTAPAVNLDRQNGLLFFPKTSYATGQCMIHEGTIGTTVHSHSVDLEHAATLYTMQTTIDHIPYKCRLLKSCSADMRGVNLTTRAKSVRKQNTVVPKRYLRFSSFCRANNTTEFDLRLARRYQKHAFCSFMSGVGYAVPDTSSVLLNMRDFPHCVVWSHTDAKRTKDLAFHTVFIK